MPYSFISQFSKNESFGGILLIASAILAIVFANTPIGHFYDQLIELPVAIQVGNFTIDKPLLLWVNDGLMAVFFLLIGLELKREFVEGELSNPQDIVLPFVGAIGGMAVPALIYVWFNYDNATAIQGWAIPSATDIAFALGVLALLGDRVPTSLKVFLTSLAIFDDVGAILIIALFYTSKISFISLFIAAVCVILLFIINQKGVSERSPYFFVGFIMWVAFLKSGVHATLAGIVLAMFIPMKSNKTDNRSPLKNLEEDLHSLVTMFILPLFAFCNSGINLANLTFEQLSHDVTLGITFGLFFGNQIGIMTLCWLAVKCKIAQLPSDINWGSLYGVACLCGIGFTMSLFIGSLAFEQTGINMTFDERIGIFLGSILSGCLGYLILNRKLKPT